MAENPESSRPTTAWLLAATVLALALRLYASAQQPLDHNGAWHVFAARNLSRELTHLAHPPLFLLILAACDALSRTLLSFRLVPILSGAASVFLIGRILEKLGARASVAVLAAFAAACAPSAILISVEVEGYALCVLFLLAALWHYLDFAAADAPAARRARALFAVFVSLALLTHYFAGLFLAAAVLAPLGAALLVPGIGDAWRRSAPSRLRADAFTLLPPLAVGVLLYELLARPWVHPLNNVRLFYYRPGEETLAGFWVRNLKETFNLISPVPLAQARYALPLLVVFLAIAIAAPVAGRRGDARTARRVLPAMMLAALVALGMILGALGRYPFGGEMRHQFLILVFALIAGAVALDAILDRLPAAGRLAALAAAAAAIAVDLAAHWPQLTSPSPSQPLTYKTGIYREHLADARVVHVDGFNLIGMAMDYSGWDWRFVGRSSVNPATERYELSDGSRGSRRLTVIAHRGIWLMDFRSPALFAELDASFALAPEPCQRVFCVYRNLYGPGPGKPLPAEIRAALNEAIPALAASRGLTATRLVLADDFVSADLCRSSASAP